MKETGYIVVRVSKDEQKSGYSLDAQLNLLQSKAEERNIHIPLENIFSIAESASKKQRRKEFEKVIERLEQNPGSWLLVEKVDRWTRNCWDTARMFDLVDQNNIKFWAVKHGEPIDKNSQAPMKLSLLMGATISTYFAWNLKDEIKKAHKEKLERGEYPGFAPTGYKNIRENGKSKIIEDPVTKDGVLMAFQMRAKETPFDDIVIALNDAGHKVRSITGKLKPYRRNTLQGLLSNSFYIGEFKWGGKTHSNQGINRDQKPTYEPFISRELFDKVQEVNEAHKHESRVEDDDLFLKSLLRCGICGTVMVNHGGGNSKRGKKSYKYYRCSYTKNPKDNGNGKRTACGQGLHSPEKTNEFFGDKIINPIRKTLKETVVNSIMDGLKQERLNQDKNLSKEIKKLKDRMIAIEDEKKSLTSKITALDIMGEKGKKLLEAITEKFNELCDSQTRIEEQIDKLENSKHDYVAEGKWLLNHLKTITEEYSKRKGVEKLQILETMVKKITLNGKNLDKAKIDLKEPFDFLYEIGKDEKLLAKLDTVVTKNSPNGEWR